MNNKEFTAEADVFFNLSHDLMIVLGYDGTVKQLNPAWEKVFGYSMNELLTTHTVDTVHTEDLPVSRQLFEELCNGRSKAIDYTERRVTKSGELYYFAWNLVSDSEKQLIYGIGRNVTSQVELINQLRLNENRYNALFRNSAFGVMLINEHGSILEINDQLLKRLGYERDELLNQSAIKIMISEEDMEPALENLTELRERLIPSINVERRIRSKNGFLSWSRIGASLIELSPGETAIMVLIEDINEEKISRRELDEVERRFEAVFNSSPSGIIITRNQGEILHTNPAFAEMLGYHPQDLIGKDVFQFTYEPDQQDTLKMVNLLNSGQISEYDLEKRYVRRDGNTFWAKTWVSLMERNGKDVIRVAIVENIDRRKKAEQKLEEKNKELMEINQELEHFAYVASHDLQEPLRTVASFIQILEKRYGHLLDEDGQQFMMFVVEGAKRMQSLIRDLLEYSRINRFNTDYEKVDLNEVFQTVNRGLKEKIDSTDAVILAENLPSIQGNKIQLTQIFQNLIDNAIKFRGDKKPEIIISVKELPSKWEISVRDNGIGISQEYFQRIFIIFQRLHTHEEYSGTGIGLALCKKIIERHGGEIWLDSVPGQGTNFTFTIAKNLIRAVS